MGPERFSERVAKFIGALAKSWVISAEFSLPLLHKVLADLKQH